MASVTRRLPPLHTNIGRTNEPRSATSCVRLDRIGPTGSATLLWKTAANRVRCSTFSSKTMSASLSPLCGRASGWLSILTTIAGRAAATGSVTGRRVSGYVGPGMVVVVTASVVGTGAVVVVGLSVVVVVGRTVVATDAVCESEAGLHAGGSSTAATASAVHRRRIGLELPQQFDALLQRRMGVEHGMQ